MSIVSLPANLLYLDADIRFNLKHREAIKTMAKHIMALGLLNPLRIKRVKDRYVVLDGKIRYCALNILRRQKTLPRSLTKIPCEIVDDFPQDLNRFEKPYLMSDAELYEAITKAHDRKLSVNVISKVFCCSEKTVKSALSLKHLNDKLFSLFQRGILDLEQSSAFATMGNKEAQWALLIQLGPFVEDKNIINAIEAGKTVVELPSEDILILPSRHSIRAVSGEDETFSVNAIAA